MQDERLAEVADEVSGRIPELVDVTSGTVNKILSPKAVYTYLSPSAGFVAIQCTRQASSGYLVAKDSGCPHIGVYFLLSGHDNAQLGEVRAKMSKEVVEADGRFDKVYFIPEHVWLTLFPGKMRKAWREPGMLPDRGWMANFSASAVAAYTDGVGNRLKDPGQMYNFVSGKFKPLYERVSRWAAGKDRVPVCIHPFMGSYGTAITPAGWVTVVERLIESGRPVIVVGDLEAERMVLEATWEITGDGTPGNSEHPEVTWSDYLRGIERLESGGMLINLMDENCYQASAVAAKTSGWCITEPTKTSGWWELWGSGLVQILRDDGAVHRNAGTVENYQAARIREGMGGEDAADVIISAVVEDIPAADLLHGIRISDIEV